MSGKEFRVSVSPHVKSTETIGKLMWTVILALTPAFLASIYFFGVSALIITLSCILSCMITEFLIVKKFKTNGNPLDGAAILTGMLLAFCLPPTVPIWIPIVGGIFAMGVVKHAFGGLGCNIFNPALMARAFLMASWPVIMTTWARPFDAVTSATPLAIAKMQGMGALKQSMGNGISLYWNLFTGNVSGCIGETSVLLLILGGLFLIWRKVITIETPLTYILTVGTISVLTGQDIVLHFFAGGLMLGAFFMATDYVTTPMTAKGKAVFGIGCGILTMIIRMYGGMPEGVSYSILLMNTATPLIDRYTKTRPKGVGL